MKQKRIKRITDSLFTVNITGRSYVPYDLQNELEKWLNMYGRLVGDVRSLNDRNWVVKFLLVTVKGLVIEPIGQ